MHQKIIYFLLSSLSLSSEHRSLKPAVVNTKVKRNSWRKGERKREREREREIERERETKMTHISVRRKAHFGRWCWCMSLQLLHFHTLYTKRGQHFKNYRGFFSFRVNMQSTEFHWAKMDPNRATKDSKYMLPKRKFIFHSTLPSL